jgi:Fe-S oxidoreductase
MLKDVISSDHPLIGIEPSGILTFRDEYPELADKENLEASHQLAKNAVMFDEFFMKEVAEGNIKPEQFTEEALHIKLHGHCQQKAVASTEPTRQMLSFPVNYTVDEIPAGCCGMAGAFGYEKEHYELSMKIGEMVLFPEVRKATKETIIAAPGTSCRHQIKEGTQRTSWHPVEVMWEALIKNKP